MTASIEDVPPSAADRPSRRRAAVMTSLSRVVLVLVVLADVLAFNQLATQSPIDGIIQLSVVGVGLAGSVEAIRRLGLASTRFDRALGLPFAVLAVLALFGWRTQWPIGSAVLLCAASGALWIVVGVRALARAENHPTSSQFPGVLSIAQALILMWFAVLAGISARAVLFG